MPVRAVRDLLLATLLLLLLGCGTPDPQTPPRKELPLPEVQTSPTVVDAPPADALSARIDKVVDGDTVYLDSGRKVRLIGIDTPERGEPFYDEATRKLQELCSPGEVRLTFDEEREDRYGRSLCYLYVPNGSGWIFANARLVETGLARIYTFPPNTRHRDLLLELQTDARHADRGLWAKEPKGDEPYYLGSATKFHRPSCSNARRMKDPVRFETRGAALDTGRSPARCCHP